MDLGAPRPPETWTPQEVAENVRRMGDDFGSRAGEYADIIAREDINGKAFMVLNVDDLKELGFSMGHRKLLIAHIATLKDNASAAELIGREGRASAEAIISEVPPAPPSPDDVLQTWTSGLQTWAPEMIDTPQEAEAGSIDAGGNRAGWGSVLQGLWSKGQHTLPDKSDEGARAAAGNRDEETPSAGAAALVKAVWTKHVGNKLVQPSTSGPTATPAAQEPTTPTTTASEGADDGHIGGVRGLPKVGLLKLWNKREEILGKMTQAASTVVASARGAEAKEQATGLAQGGGRSCGGAAQAAQRVKNPLRFLGRDEWLALVPLQV
jgi:hypothetical protein